MRLHSLDLQAIGPFATPQRIDFDELTASGLFLLDGPTGAGKTTVLDAITFALYGPGERGGDDRLRSDFAPPGTEPRVCLEFSLRGVRHRITRTPEFDRPKRRGTGVTRQAASAHLERFQDGVWLSRSSNKAEIGDLLADEIGLSRDQFGQVVLLPQGEFARFLRSSDDDRRQLLTRLFGTQLYDRITDELDRRRQIAAREVDAAAARVAGCVAAAAEAAGLDADEREQLTMLSVAERTARLTATADALVARRRAASAALEKAEAATAAARAAFDQLSAQSAIVQRFLAVQSERTGHHAVAAKVDAAREVLAAALRAEPVRPLLAVLDRAVAAADTARKAAGSQSADEIQKAIEQQRAVIEAAAVATERATAMQPRISAARRVATLQPNLDAAIEARTKAVHAHQAAVDEHQALVDARLSGMAAELATSLQDGLPCAVCGSLEHPAPAEAASDAIGAAEVRAAQARREKTERNRRRAEELVAEVEQSLAAAREVAGAASVAELTDEMTGLETAVAAGESAKRAERRLRRSLDLAVQLAAAEEAVVSARGHAELEATAAKFETLDAARAAVRAPDARTDLERRVAEWDAKSASLEAALDVPEFAELRALPPAELETHCAATVQQADVARSKFASVDSARTEAVTAADRAQRALVRLAERRAELAEAEAVHVELSAAAEPVLHLSKLTKGMGGQRRVALTTYVLRHWFEHVVQAANIRLGTISSGRYELIRVDEGASKSERAGLTLQVVDRHTGEARSPRSLSGGETFYTSLALALGLADVVKAEAGGIDLDTLFIDEGFGTLDSDTLDQVMTVIDDLRDRGRIVGVVSHVADLKDRIPERLEVRRLPDGSSALRVVA